MKKLTLILALLFVLSTVGCANAKSTALQASGQIEAKEIAVAPELSGRVVKVSVNEGDSVKAGDTVLVLDDSLLAAQRTVAVSQLDSAKAGVQAAQNALASVKSQYQIALEAALAQGERTRLKDWFSDPNQFEQPGWYYTREEQIQAAQSQVDTAQKAVQDAQANLDSVSQALEQANFLKAERRLLDARLAYLIAKDVNNQAQNSATRDTPKGLYNSTHCGTNKGYFVENAQLTNQLYKCTGDKHLGDAGRTLYNDAQAELEDAQKAYDLLLDSEAANTVLQARADLAVAQERYYSALDFLRKLRTGDQATSVTAAQSTVDQAQAAIEQAQKTVDQAQASIDLIDTQIKKLTITAPVDGVVLVRGIDVGEVIQAGMPAMTIGKLDTLKVTVYIPEDQYGQISLGEQASLKVDSFPAETFSATVTRISNQAEFTPQNVQTKEGRQTTVYAVELTVNNSNGKLKPGMPTDVTFASQVAAK
ncbi:MAG TPA: HlyD family efflux transporter periplasmic adaptor subunit [Anaerolineales bacterium]|nr:HlyD family efflux transporter periplasmic adaptor subunit [Anaerolineales bacterium]